MAALTASTTERVHTLGDLNLRVYSFAAVANGDTYALSGAQRILGAWPIKVGTSASITAAISGQTITFAVSAGNPTATIAILSN